MAIAKVIEVIGESDTGWEEAAQTAVAQATQSVRNVKHLYVKNMTAEVEGGKIVRYRVNAKVTFVVED